MSTWRDRTTFRLQGAAAAPAEEEEELAGVLAGEGSPAEELAGEAPPAVGSAAEEGSAGESSAGEGSAGEGLTGSSSEDEADRLLLEQQGQAGKASIAAARKRAQQILIDQATKVQRGSVSPPPLPVHPFHAQLDQIREAFRGHTDERGLMDQARFKKVLNDMGTPIDMKSEEFKAAINRCKQGERSTKIYVDQFLVFIGPEGEYAHLITGPAQRRAGSSRSRSKSRSRKGPGYRAPLSRSSSPPRLRGAAFERMSKGPRGSQDQPPGVKWRPPRGQRESVDRRGWLGEDLEYPPQPGGSFTAGVLNTAPWDSSTKVSDKTLPLPQGELTTQRTGRAPKMPYKPLGKKVKFRGGVRQEEVGREGRTGDLHTRLAEGQMTLRFGAEKDASKRPDWDPRFGAEDEPPSAGRRARRDAQAKAQEAAAQAWGQKHWTNPDSTADRGSEWSSGAAGKNESPGQVRQRRSAALLAEPLRRSQSAPEPPPESPRARARVRGDDARAQARAQARAEHREELERLQAAAAAAQPTPPVSLSAPADSALGARRWDKPDDDLEGWRGGGARARRRRYTKKRKYTKKRRSSKKRRSRTRRRRR
jgi:hypothetical protein